MLDWPQIGPDYYELVHFLPTHTKQSKTVMASYIIARVKHLSHLDQFRCTLGEKFQEYLNPSNDGINKWPYFKDIITKTTKDVLTPFAFWFDENNELIQAALIAKNMSYVEWRSDLLSRRIWLRNTSYKCSWICGKYSTRSVWKKKPEEVPSYTYISSHKFSGSF